jgi:hypothetical protein
MTNLTKQVSRVSAGTVREAGKTRQVVVTLKPPNLLGFRAKGCRQTYRFTTDACYTAAVKAEVADQQRQKRKKQYGKRTK